MKTILLEKGECNTVAVVSDDGTLSIYTTTKYLYLHDMTFSPNVAKRLAKALTPLADGPITMHCMCLTRTLDRLPDGWTHEVVLWEDQSVTTRLVGPGEDDNVSITLFLKPCQAKALAVGLVATVPTAA